MKVYVPDAPTYPQSASIRYNWLAHKRLYQFLDNLNLNTFSDNVVGLAIFRLCHRSPITIFLQSSLAIDEKK